MTAAARDLQTLFAVGSLGGLSDGQLLDRFAERREPAVFEAIVRCHGPMVWGVCRRVLRDHHDAEDAFQATFLVLTRRASSVMMREKLGNWLYGVAYRTAMKARALRAKRWVREVGVSDMPERGLVHDDRLDDLLAQLDRELSRLPSKYRIPIVLCELEGKTHREAAEQLGWPVGTVSGRLSRARAMLARRLSRRGVSLSAGSLAVFLAQEPASASMPLRLIDSTAQAASLFAAGGAVTAGAVSAEVTALTEEVLRIMLLSKIKITTAVLLVGVTLTVVGASVGRGESGLGLKTELSSEAQPANKKIGGSDRRGKLAPQKPHVPAMHSNVFGGGPGEPRYERSGNLVFVTSPLGDKFSIYHTVTNKAYTIRLPSSKESLLQVTPVEAERDGSVVALTLSGPKLTRLYVFSLEDWKWYPQDLKEPVAGVLTPIVDRLVAAYAQGRTIYAFSTVAQRWSILELPKEAPAQPSMSVMNPGSLVVDYHGQIYEFNSKTCEWKHTDLRALIDAAIKSAEDGAN